MARSEPRSQQSRQAEWYQIQKLARGEPTCPECGFATLRERAGMLVCGTCGTVMGCSTNTKGPPKEPPAP